MNDTQIRGGFVTNIFLLNLKIVLMYSVLCWLPFSVKAVENHMLLEEWLSNQVAIKTWTADVVQTRKIKSLVRPLESWGQVWFVHPNQFRWQLSKPPHTIAVRNQQELLIVYPKLKQMERYLFDNITNPAMQQALALLEVGFPSDPKRFHERYELLAVTTIDEVRRFELQPRDKQARRLLAKVRLDVSTNDFILLATELEFPDGSTLRNSFSNHRLNVELDASLFQIDTSDYTVVQPLRSR